MNASFANLPSVHEVIESPKGRDGAVRFGHTNMVAAVRTGIDALRDQLRSGATPPGSRTEVAEGIADRALEALQAADQAKMRRVFNLTGTVLHTNLGRAIYAEAAVEAANVAMRYPLALEYDLETGRRGQRDDAVQQLVAEIVGAEDACIVNNNASAVLLVLAALGQGRETIVSRGELIEIGGSFRMPEIMASAGTRLREVGTTNRTHLKDYKTAIGPDAALLMKVHTSNYKVMGFTKEVTGAELAELSRQSGVPFVDDLGSGVLTDLSKWGLQRERTVQEAIADGADLVTFSGDKLLGGPQAGFIAGRKEFVRACASHPLKRALRLDKVRLAALEATLKLYRVPENLHGTLPTLRYLSKNLNELRQLAEKILPLLAAVLHSSNAPEIVDTQSQVGSGAMPLETVPSIGIRIPAAGGAADRIALAFRKLPIPVIGRIAQDGVVFDLRCLDDIDEFVGQFHALAEI